MDIFKSEDIKKAINSNASNSICGFLYQFQRALFRIFSSSSSNMLVGIETLDDVSTLTRSENGELALDLEQNKYTGKENYNPFGDKDRNLWHTLNIWLSNLKTYRNSYVDVNFFLTTNAIIPLDSLVLKISNADSSEKINEIISIIRTISGTTKNKEIKEVSKYDDESLFFVIKKTTVFWALENTEKISTLRDATVQKLQLHSTVSECADEVYEHLLGAIINQSLNKWQKKEQAWLEVQAFRDLLHNLQTRIPLKKYIDRDIFSVDFQKYIENNKDLAFLSQLTSLNLPYNYIDDQLKSYWGFYAEKIRLQNEGYVLPNDWEEREKIKYSLEVFVSACGNR